MRIIQANKNKPIALGFQGENDAVTVQFDVKGWADLYGAGYFTLLNQRPTESVGYPCTVTVADEVVSWVVSYTDVFIEGTGHVQLTYTVGEKLAKSVQYFTLVRKSINVGEVPEPVPDWFYQIEEEVAEAKDIAQECLDSVEVATNAQIDAALYS